MTTANMSTLFEQNDTTPTAFAICSTLSLYTYNQRLIYGLLGGFLSLYIVCVNFLLFITFLRDRHVKRVPGHTFIVGLMVSSDVIIGMIPLPGFLLKTLCGGWPLAPWACDLWTAVDYISTNVSMISVTTVAFDRFLATNFVFAHKRWMHRANQNRLCIFLWIVTAVRNIIVFPVWANVSDFRRSEPPGQCGHPLYANFTVGLFQRTLALYIPVILLVFFYGAVVLKIFQSSPHFNSHMALTQKQKSPVSNSTQSCSSTAKLEHSQADLPSSTNTTSTTYSRTSILASRVSKSFRIVTCVIVSFLVTNLPWNILENMIATHSTHVQKTDSIYILSWIMTYMNAFLNPLFYPFMHNEYKRIMLRWLHCQRAQDSLRTLVSRTEILIPTNVLYTKGSPGRDPTIIENDDTLTTTGVLVECATDSSSSSRKASGSTRRTNSRGGSKSKTGKSIFTNGTGMATKKLSLLEQYAKAEEKEEYILQYVTST